MSGLKAPGILGQFPGNLAPSCFIMSPGQPRPGAAQAGATFLPPLPPNSILGGWRLAPLCWGGHSQCCQAWVYVCPPVSFFLPHCHLHVF